MSTRPLVHLDLVGPGADGVVIPPGGPFVRDVVPIDFHQIPGAPLGKEWDWWGSFAARAAGHVPGGDAYRGLLASLRSSVRAVLLDKMASLRGAANHTLSGIPRNDAFDGVVRLDFEPFAQCLWPSCRRDPSNPSDQMNRLYDSWMGVGGSHAGWVEWTLAVQTEIAAECQRLVGMQCTVLRFGPVFSTIYWGAQSAGSEARIFAWNTRQAKDVSVPFSRVYYSREDTPRREFLGEIARRSWFGDVGMHLSAVYEGTRRVKPAEVLVEELHAAADDSKKTPVCLWANVGIDGGVSAEELSALLAAMVAKPQTGPAIITKASGGTIEGVGGVAMTLLPGSTGRRGSGSKG